MLYSEYGLEVVFTECMLDRAPSCPTIMGIPGESFSVICNQDSMMVCRT